MTSSATARACSNIAFIKYWGNTDDSLRLPANGSLSMNLAELHTTTTVTFDEALPADRLTLNGQVADSPTLERVTAHLDRVRKLADTNARAQVISVNSFPMGTGIASSASGFAALTVAACAAADLNLAEDELSGLARLGSGSASRSIPAGYVEWQPGDHATSVARSIAAPEHWELVDLVAIASETHKAVGSTGGHAVAPTSPLQAARIADAPRRLDGCRTAILERDFAALAAIAEEDTLQMHAVMMTSQPALLYWEPATLRAMQAIREWRAEGQEVFFTIDAGPNVHVICPQNAADEIEAMLGKLDGISRVMRATPGGAAILLD